jgi:GNAT superfamily N-acetyltransferase
MTSETLRKRIEDMTVLIARNEAGLVLGTIGAAVRGVEGHIRGMAVLPSSQGAGLADRLLETIERELTRAGCSLVQIYSPRPLLKNAQQVS